MLQPDHTLGCLHHQHLVVLSLTLHIHRRLTQLPGGVAAPTKHCSRVGEGHCEVSARSHRQDTIVLKGRHQRWHLCTCPRAYAKLSFQAASKGVEPARSREKNCVLGAARHRGNRTHLVGKLEGLRGEVDLTGGVCQRLRDGGEGGGVELFLCDPLPATFLLCCLPQPSFNLENI